MSYFGLLKALISATDSRDVRADASTHSLQTISYGHHEIHSGSSFSVHLFDLTFAKNGEMGILFTVPNTTKWIHVIPLVEVADKSSFEILEAPTLDVGNYPTTFYEPINRNRNSTNDSVVSSVRAAPVVNQVSLILDGDTTPVSADGTVIHGEVIGGAKNKTAGGGVRDIAEYILDQGVTYYFRVVGDNTGTGALGLSMELSWYEHTDKN
jgi:hypothetical protein